MHSRGAGNGDVDQMPLHLPMQDITLCRTTDPRYSSLGFPDSGTLAGYQLHQMHLMTSDVIQPYP